MLGRYAIAFGRGAHRHELGARAAAVQLPVRIETPELLLVAPTGTPCLSEGGAILVGQIFAAASERLDSLPAGLAEAANVAKLRSALDGHWGNFAFFCASEEESIVYREPSGSVPVYKFGEPHQTIFASDAELAVDLCLTKRAAMDARFLVHWLQFPFLRTSRTGLAGVRELLPGALMTRTGSGSWNEGQGWHPASFVGRSEAIDDPGQAASRLRETALSVVAAQADARPFALRLSGGLDSSIIAVCLSQAGFRFPCINFATRSRDGDERDYARAVAERFGLQLVEIVEHEGSGLIPPVRASFRPPINPLLAPFERAIEAAATELGASLLIDGGGGDNLFCSISSAAPVIDALRRSGPRTAGRAIADIAERAECTAWDVVAAASRRLLKPRTSWKEDRSLLNRRALLRAPELHPWLQDLPAQPGKREHVEALVHIQHFLDRGIGSEVLHPLLAQPLLELCLRIPSWLWLRGGRDRAVARDAFAGLVPDSVLRRRVKGSLQSLLYRSFEQLREEMRDRLASGELARAGIVNPKAIQDALTGEAWKTDLVQLRISEMVALELWLESWRSSPWAASSPS